MYYLVAIIIIIIGVFLLYRFFREIDNFIKKYFIPSQNLIDIKSEMKKLDTSSNIDENDEHVSQYTKISNKVIEILYLPADLLYKSIIIYGTPIYYKITQLYQSK
jgi:hypothetical protein